MTWFAVSLAGLNVFQTVCLAWIAARYRGSVMRSSQTTSTQGDAAGK